MKKERAKRSEMRSHCRKTRSNNLVGIPENHSISDEHSENVSIATHEEPFPITAVIKDQKDNIIDKYNKDINEQV